MLLFGLLAGAGFALVLAPPVQPLLEALAGGLAAFSSGIIHLTGGHVRSAGDLMTAPDSGFSMKIANGCNGVNVIVLLWSAYLAWPAALIGKLKGMILGALVIQAANVIRIIILFYLGQWNATWFEWMHVYIGEILIIILGLAVFAASIRQTPASAVPDPAP